ncbi:MAG: hypothetical protein MUC87_08835 [Bacteroidia bacterium]|jgi:hypothetical protein|nr:hypothetical protein [Bacteroidia bacterium]
MATRLCSTLLLLCVALSARAFTPADFDLKRKRNMVGIVVAAHYWQSPWAELGISYARVKTNGIFGGNYRGTAFSALYNPLEQTAGVGICRWGMRFSFITTGLRLNACTNFSDVRFTVQPQAGVGNGVFSLCYGYHFAINRAEVAGMNLPHEISLRVNIEIKEIEREKWWKRN